MFASMMREDSDRIDSVKIGISKMVAYLLDWSGTDADGQPILIRDQPATVVVSALDALEVESFTEILRAIEAHEDAMEKARVQEKNGQAGEIASSPISPSAA